MKHLTTLLLLLCSMYAMAQDVIVKKDGSTIICHVEKVTETQIAYTDQKGSINVMDKALVSAINYENGKKETFSEATTPKQSETEEGVQSMSDTDLERLYLELNADKLRHNEEMEKMRLQAELQAERTRIQKKVKRLKTWGWISGGVLFTGGTVCLIYGGMYADDDDIGMFCGVGAALVAAGAGLTTSCLVAAHKQKKKLNTLQTASIYRYDVPFSNGSSLSFGADMLNDRIMNNRTVGLGLSYNF